MNDPGCENAADQDETNSTSSGGGGGGGGGGSAATTTATSTGEVLGAEDVVVPPPAPMCDTYLTAFIGAGKDNDPEQVKRLQSVLIESEGADIEENGEYDEKTLAAVHAFQTKYAEEILAPWNIEHSTGYVYLTTRKKVNELYCKSLKEFPLTEAEKETMASIMSQGTYVDVPRAPLVPAEPEMTVPVAPKVKAEPAAKTQPASAAGSDTDDAEDEETSERPTRSLWRPIGDFFNRLFNRGN
jgi:hypothetical protein